LGPILFKILLKLIWVINLAKNFFLKQRLEGKRKGIFGQTQFSFGVKGIYPGEGGFLGGWIIFQEF